MPPRRRILVVDDDPYARDLAATALRGQGYEVVGAARFQQGLDAARAQRPHLILCDVVLPDGSGVDLAKALRHELPERDVPIVILMSAFSKGRLADQRHMKDEARAVAFLTKPLSLPTVVDLVQQQLPLSVPAASPPPDAETAQLMVPPNGTAEALPAAPSPSPAPMQADATRTPARPEAGAPAGSGLLVGLANAWRKGWTGTLIVRRQQAEKRIVLERGQIVWCTTTLTEERLGRVLLRLGLLPRDQYEPGLKEALETKHRLGEVLVERGYLTPSQLDEAVVQQMEAIVLGALAWPEGSYRVVGMAGRPPGDDRVVVSPVPRLVLRAFREAISGDRLDARLAAVGDAPVARRRDIPGAALAQLSPSPE
ncbi:MAG TPA: response regulator, partial [Methylomirabilota bacterium]|nr:response regulator [Methylomirabilota bacterium]